MRLWPRGSGGRWDRGRTLPASPQGWLLVTESTLQLVTACLLDSPGDDRSASSSSAMLSRESQGRSPEGWGAVTDPGPVEASMEQG